MVVTLVFKCEYLGQYIPYEIIMIHLHLKGHDLGFERLGVCWLHQLYYLQRSFEAWAFGSFLNDSLLNLYAY